MRTVLFFVLSAAVHLAAFVYPVSFRQAKGERILPLTIVTLREPTTPPKTQNVKPSPPARAFPSKTPGQSAPRALRLLPPATKARSAKPPVTTEQIAPMNDTPQSVVGLIAPSTNHDAPPPVVRADLKSSRPLVEKKQEQFFEPEDSTDHDQVMTRFTSARYDKTPKPNYPEAARRAGKEGRVLLRVLVDEEGRSKTIDINQSSGSEVLDQAAAEAMKRWRFHPARLGDEAVQSWVRIPIDFLLDDSRE